MYKGQLDKYWCIEQVASHLKSRDQIMVVGKNSCLPEIDLKLSNNNKSSASLDHFNQTCVVSIPVYWLLRSDSENELLISFVLQIMALKLLRLFMGVFMTQNCPFSSFWFLLNCQDCKLSQVIKIYYFTKS